MPSLRIGAEHADTELARKIHEVVTWQPAEADALAGFPKKWIG